MKKLIILHGALGAKKQFWAIEQELKLHFDVTVLEFEGHGKTTLQGEFNVPNFAKQLEELVSQFTEKPVVFGYSMGGYVALKYATNFPSAFERLITLGTKFEWNVETALKESGQLVPEKIEEKVPAFAAYLQDLHGTTQWRTVLENTAEMMLAMGEDPPLSPTNLHNIDFPVTLSLGSEDVMVTRNETELYAQALPKGEYREMAGWKHPIDRIPTDELVSFLKESFLL